MKEYQEIRDTSPLGLKMLNDQLRLLWFRVKNTTTKDIRDGAVTGEKIQNESIDGKHIKPKSITTGHIEADFATIEDLQTVNAKIDNLVVNTAMIEDLAVTNAKIANAAIDTSNIKLGAITTALIDTGAIETAQIADGSITDAKIVDLTANKINAGTLDVERLIIRSSTEPEKSLIYEINNITGALQSVQGNTLNGEILTDRSITTDKIVANAITANEIASKTITANEIASNAVTADKISVNTLSAITANLGTITAGTITGATVRTGSGGNRIELSSNLLRAYSSGVRRVQLDYDSLDFYNASNQHSGTVYGITYPEDTIPRLVAYSKNHIELTAKQNISEVYPDVEARIIVSQYNNDYPSISMEVNKGSKGSQLYVTEDEIGFLTGSIHSTADLNMLGRTLTVNRIHGTRWQMNMTHASYIYMRDGTNTSTIRFYPDTGRIWTSGELYCDKEATLASGNLTVKTSGSANVIIDNNDGGYNDVTIRPSSSNRGNLGSGTYYWNNAYSAKWNQGSQRANKENIQLYDEEQAYEQLKDIPIYTYTFKNDQFSDHNIGTMIDYMPIEIVDTTRLGRTEEGEIGMWASGSAIFFLMAACKVLQKKVEELELRLEGVLS